MFRRTKKMRLYKTTALQGPVFGLRREIDRLFDETFAGNGGVSGWTPAVDIREDETELNLSLELAGVNPENVEITAENGILTVRGEKQEERKEKEEGRYFLAERTYGSFVRSFQLPQGLDESKISADFEHGLLRIHVPKTALPKPRRIQIASGSKGEQKGTKENVAVNEK
jgi:HSP20 family protein